MHARVKNFHLSISLDAARCHFAGTFRFNADSLGLLCEQLGGKALDIENDLSNIFLNAGDSRELVLYAVDLDRQ